MHNTDQIIQNLASQFKANGKPAHEQDFESFVEKMKEIKVTNPAIPEELEKMWKLASEWHLIEDHYNVFGFNIYSPSKVIETTFQVMGNEDLKKEWAQENGTDSCGGQDWLCLAGYSEFDYVFVNFNKESPLFGATRHMVNNQNVDKEASNAPFYNFFAYAERRCEEYFKEVEEEE